MGAVFPVLRQAWAGRLRGAPVLREGGVMTSILLLKTGQSRKMKLGSEGRFPELAKKKLSRKP